MATVKAVLFDLGGTLLHYRDLQTEENERHFRRVTLLGLQYVSDALAEAGHDMPAFEVLNERLDHHIWQAVQLMQEEQRSAFVEDAIRAALTDIDVMVSDDEWAEVRHAFYRAIDGTVFPREGIVETLSALEAEGYQLGLISNTFWAADLHDRHIHEHSFMDYFPLRIYTSDEAYVKPHPSPFEKALRALNTAPEEAVYIGDTPQIDVIGAQGAGLRAVLIQSPYVDGVPDDIVPDAMIDELPDLLRVLATWRA